MTIFSVFVQTARLLLKVDQSKSASLVLPIGVQGGRVLVEYGCGHELWHRPLKFAIQCYGLEPANRTQNLVCASGKTQRAHGWQLLGYRAGRSRSGADKDMSERYDRVLSNLCQWQVYQRCSWATSASQNVTFLKELIQYMNHLCVPVADRIGSSLVVAQMGASCANLQCQTRLWVTRPSRYRTAVRVSAHSSAYITEEQGFHPGPGSGGVTVSCPLSQRLSSPLSALQVWTPSQTASPNPALRGPLTSCTRAAAWTRGLILDSGPLLWVSHTHTPAPFYLSPVFYLVRFSHIDYYWVRLILITESDPMFHFLVSHFWMWTCSSTCPSTILVFCQVLLIIFHF